MARPAAAASCRRPPALPPSSLAALLLLLFLAGAAGPAGARLYEEFEVFLPPGGPAGRLEVDQHFNYGFRGRREREEDGALPTDRGLYINTEISYAVTSRYTLALELPSAVTADGRYHFGGFKLRNLLSLGAEGAWSWGLLAELQHQPSGFLPHPWALLASPLLAWQQERWSAALNLGVGVAVGARGSESFFEPAARLAWAATGDLALAVEYYGEAGRVERPERLGRQGHQLLAITELELGPAQLRLGIGRGLTPASDRWVGTVVLGFDF